MTRVQCISKSAKRCGAGRDFWTVDRVSRPAVGLYSCGPPGEIAEHCGARDGRLGVSEAAGDLDLAFCPIPLCKSPPAGTSRHLIPVPNSHYPQRPRRPSPRIMPWPPYSQPLRFVQKMFAYVSGLPSHFVSNFDITPQILRTLSTTYPLTLHPPRPADSAHNSHSYSLQLRSSVTNLVTYVHPGAGGDGTR